MATKMSKRQMLRTAAAGAVAVGFGNYAAAATKTVKIGLVAPQTGPLAIFSEQIPWTIKQIKKATGDKITIGGTTFLRPSNRLANERGGFRLRCGGRQPIPTSPALPERRRSNLPMGTKQRAANNGLCRLASVIRCSKSRSTSSSGLRTSTSPLPSGMPSRRPTMLPSLGPSTSRRVRSRTPAARR
jgi:hypothetical protein